MCCNVIPVYALILCLRVFRNILGHKDIHLYYLKASTLKDLPHFHFGHRASHKNTQIKGPFLAVFCFIVSLSFPLFVCVSSFLSATQTDFFFTGQCCWKSNVKTLIQPLTESYTALERKLLLAIYFTIILLPQFICPL